MPQFRSRLLLAWLGFQREIWYIGLPPPTYGIALTTRPLTFIEGSLPLWIFRLQSAETSIQSAETSIKKEDIQIIDAHYTTDDQPWEVISRSRRSFEARLVCHDGTAIAEALGQEVPS